MTDYPESHLVRLAIDGNGEAFGVLVGRHEGSLMAFVAGWTQNWVDAQDILQETFIDAFRGLNRFDTSRPFHPWLKAICRNRLRSRHRTWLRKHECLLSLSDENVERQVSAKVCSDVDSGSSEEMLSAVRSAVAKLKNRRHAELLWLRYGEEVSVEELARRRGCSPQSIAQTLYRVRGRLRESIAFRLNQIER